MLEEIIAYKKNLLPQANLFKLEPSTRNFKAKITGKGSISLIAEIKKASPSEGVIDKVFEYSRIAAEYEKAGAACLSVLTEEKFFQGSLQIMKEVGQKTTLPILRKDFIVHPREVYEARHFGADCVLLIVSILDFPLLKECQQIARSLKMDVLVEVHNEDELKTALELEEDNLIIGINNRNLSDLSIDMQTVPSLLPSVPSNYTVVAESGYGDFNELEKLFGKIDAVLIGTSLMRSSEKESRIKKLFNLHDEDET